MPYSLKRFFLLIFLSTIINSSCDISAIQGSVSASSNEVDIIVRSAGELIVFLAAPSNKKICRRGLPNESVYGLEPQERIDEEDGGVAEDGTAEPESDSAQTNQNNNIPVDVEENWFEMGLLIVNKSKKDYLVVNNLQFKISASWGDEILSSTANIGSGYCSTDPLYIVPPTPESAKNSYRGDEYHPLKQNYVNNLTLFVHGVPIPEGPPTYKEREGDGGSSTINAARKAGQSATNTALQIEEEFVLTHLPAYQVQLIAHGFWIDKKRNQVANFKKSINFTIPAQPIRN